jgi:molybdate transport system ATP-binding protein
MLSVEIKKRLGPSKTAGSSAKANAEGKRQAVESISQDGGTVRNGFTLDVTFKAEPGVTILFGASGSGKTLTLECIAGIIRPDSGRISIGDQQLFDSQGGVNLPIRSRGVGYVFQDLALFPHLSVRENVEFGMSGLPSRERREQAAAMMEALHIEETAARRPHDISGGEAQRVALARALSCRPRLLLLDEPLSAIDEATKREIIADLKKVNSRLRLPIVYVTHSREEAVSLGERVIVYDRGRITASGLPVEVLGTPVTGTVARLTGVENLFSGRIVTSREGMGTTTVEITDAAGHCLVEIPFCGDPAGSAVTVAVPSGDILLATEEPRLTSARNVIGGRIERIEEKGHGALVSVNAGVVWRASVTREAVRELGLSVGGQVWIALKTHSCYLLDR